MRDRDLPLEEPETHETRPSLLAKICDPRNEQAWNEFLDIYQPVIYRFARRKGFQDADAAELTQEVLLAVSSAIERWDPDPDKGSFRGWLFRIARNLMINLINKQDRQTQGTGDTCMKQLLEEQPLPDGDDSLLFDREFKREVFLWAAEQIQPEFQSSTWDAFWLTSVEEWDIKAVAEKLDVSLGVVYAARSRVVARLRRKIEQLEGQ